MTMEAEHDDRQYEFPFVVKTEVPPRMEASYKVRAFDCSKERHQVLPNGVCMLCKRQVENGNNEDLFR